jgi:hypothetical protein
VQRDSWGITAIRVADLAVTPDSTRLVAVGEQVGECPSEPTPMSDSDTAATTNRNDDNNNPTSDDSRPRMPESLMIVYDLSTKQQQL